MKIILFFTIIMWSSAFAEDTITSRSFDAKYCANPCHYGSTRRPGNMLCEFSLKDNSVMWMVENNSFVRKYTVISQDENVLVVEISSDKDRWDSAKSGETKYQLTFNRNHGNSWAKDDINFSVCRVTELTCDFTESMFIGIRPDGCY